MGGTFSAGPLMSSLGDMMSPRPGLEARQQDIIGLINALGGKPVNLTISSNEPGSRQIYTALATSTTLPSGGIETVIRLTGLVLFYRRGRYFSTERVAMKIQHYECCDHDHLVTDTYRELETRKRIQILENSTGVDATIYPEDAVRIPVLAAVGIEEVEKLLDFPIMKKFDFGHFNVGPWGRPPSR